MTPLLRADGAALATPSAFRPGYSLAGLSWLTVLLWPRQLGRGLIALAK
jgi:hypothetical protein